MTPYDYFRSRTQAELEGVCTQAGTKISYFEQIAYGHRRPSYELAKKLSAASGEAMSVDELMSARERQLA